MIEKQNYLESDFVGYIFLKPLKTLPRGLDEATFIYWISPMRRGKLTPREIASILRDEWNEIILVLVGGFKDSNEIDKRKGGVLFLCLLQGNLSYLRNVGDLS